MAAAAMSAAPLSSSFISLKFRRPSLVKAAALPFRTSAVSAASARTARPTPSPDLGSSLLGFAGYDDASRSAFYPSCSAPQTPATASRGAESDVMGLLLRERIVFLGGEVNDFVADAIISQLLLLDAKDHTRDIRLFINSPGGSLRCVLVLSSFELFCLKVQFFYECVLFVALYAINMCLGLLL